MQGLTEYTTSRVSLTDEDLEYLLDFVKAGGGPEDSTKVFESITPTVDEGVFQLRPGGFVGRLGLPSGGVLDIGSRFDLPEIYRMIVESARRPSHVDTLAASSVAGAFLVDALVAAFAREVGHITARGLAKGYQDRRFDRPPYPGRPDVVEHVGRFAGRPHRLITRARRITTDIEVNRALATALDVLARAPLPDMEMGPWMLRGAFAGVRRVPLRGSDVARIHLDRLTAHYRAALSLAELILDSNSIVPRAGQRSGASILFWMPGVWEAYVANRLRESLGSGFAVEAPYTFDLTRDGSLQSEADITVWDGHRLVALFDAKYKRMGDKPTTGDVYQMVTYCTRLGIDRATLVYPGRGERRRFRVEHVTITMWGMDVLAPSSAAHVLAAT